MKIICFATICKYIWNTIDLFGDLLQEKELNNDLLTLSGDTTLNNWLHSAAEMRWNNCKYTAFLKAGEEVIFFQYVKKM